jgi:hypothetical protein
MWSEHVQLDATGLLEEDGKVHVVATFRMRNTASSRQNLRARFPLEHPEGIGDGYGRFPTVENLMVEVGAAPVITIEVSEPSYWEEAAQPIRWAAFDVEFPVGRDVLITVEYDVPPRIDFSAVAIDYVLETGAAWYGAIALARIDVLLPYPVSSDNYTWSAPTWGTPRFAGNTLTWTQWDLNPTREDNFFVYLVDPADWHRIRELETMAANGQATREDFLQLSVLYWRAATDAYELSINPPLADAAERAARRGLLIDPRSSELIYQLAYIQWVSIANPLDWYYRRPPTAAEQRQIDRIRDMFLRAYDLDRNNRDALDMARFIEHYRWPVPDEQ